jgi:hypothetical protein
MVIYSGCLSNGLSFVALSQNKMKMEDCQKHTPVACKTQRVNSVNSSGLFVYSGFNTHEPLGLVLSSVVIVQSVKQKLPVLFLMLLVGIMLTDIVKGDDHSTEPATDQVFVDAN